MLSPDELYYWHRLAREKALTITISEQSLTDIIGHIDDQESVLNVAFMAIETFNTYYLKTQYHPEFPANDRKNLEKSLAVALADLRRSVKTTKCHVQDLSHMSGGKG